MISISSSKFLENYFWIVGLSLITSGIVLIFYDPLAILGAGILFAIIAAFLNGRGQRNKNNYLGTLYSSRTHKPIALLLKNKDNEL